MIMSLTNFTETRNRAAVVRQLLAESLVLAVIGGAAGLALGWAGARGLKILAEQHLAVWQDVRIDARVVRKHIGWTVRRLPGGEAFRSSVNRPRSAPEIIPGGHRGGPPAKATCDPSPEIDASHAVPFAALARTMPPLARSTT